VHPTMMQPGGLAERLAHLRKAARLTAGQLAQRLGWGETSTGRTKISKIENGRQMPTADEIRAWASACDQAGAADDLVLMLADAQATYRSVRGYLRHGNAPVQDEYDRRVRATTLIRNSAPNVIPSFIQTAGYARSLLTQAAALWGTMDVDAAVQTRLRRQEVLYDPSKTFQFVITEAALRLLPCPPDVMLGQLAWLERFLNLGLGNITLGIVPMGTELAIVPTTDFLMLDGQAIVETHAGEVTAGELDSAKYAEIFDMLMAEALTGPDAQRLITAAASNLQGEG
jgi:transcriptional regulator with XRE-family HTH domain